MIVLSTLLVAILMQGGVPPVRSLDKGAQSGVSVPREATVRDADEWATLWRAHASGRPRPEVDFSREMVVGVFVGSRPTAGFAVEVVGVRDAGPKAGLNDAGNETIVQYRETVPARDAITAQMITSPYHLVAIPKRAGTVRFEKVKTEK